MKRLVFILCLLAAPAAAQNKDLEEGAQALSRGMQLLMEGLMAELTPRMDELRGWLDELDAYHAPEVLENGDILIRRKSPDEMDGEDTDEIEL